MKILLAENEDKRFEVASCEVFERSDAEVLQVKFLHLPAHVKYNMRKLLSVQYGKGIDSKWILELELDL